MSPSIMLHAMLQNRLELLADENNKVMALKAPDGEWFRTTHIQRRKVTIPPIMLRVGNELLVPYDIEPPQGIVPGSIPGEYSAAPDLNTLSQPIIYSEEFANTREDYGGVVNMFQGDYSFVDAAIQEHGLGIVVDSMV